MKQKVCQKVMVWALGVFLLGSFGSGSFEVANAKPDKETKCHADYVFLQKVPKVFYWDGKRQEGYDIKDLAEKWHHNKDLLIKNLYLSCAVSKFKSCHGKMKLQVVSKNFSEVLKLQSYKKNINENWYRTENFNLDKHLPESMTKAVKVDIKIFRDGGYLCTKTINII